MSIWNGMKLDDIEIGNLVDEKSTELIAEFHAHYLGYIKDHPEHAERRDLIFHGWAIQKIAGLQLSILSLEGTCIICINNCRPRR